VTEPGGLEMPNVDRVESRIAWDLARHALWAAPLPILAVGLWRGWAGAGAVAIAFVLVVANFLASAGIVGWTARNAPHLLMGAALFGFLLRVGVVFLVALGIQALDIVDMGVLAVTLLVTHLGLLFWETRSISLSLASPGLKPRAGELPRYES
jgi:hypothetical protein